MLSAGGVTSIEQTQKANKVDNKPKMPIIKMPRSSRQRNVLNKLECSIDKYTSLHLLFDNGHHHDDHKRTMALVDLDEVLLLHSIFNDLTIN